MSLLKNILEKASTVMLEIYLEEMVGWQRFPARFLYFGKLIYLIPEKENNPDICEIISFSQKVNLLTQR